MKHKIMISNPRYLIISDGMTVEEPLKEEEIENLAGDVQNFLMSKGIVAEVSHKETQK